ncbi:prepilin peptidase [Moellerella wisconsensis]|uniref:Leader peptidase/prepilin peptidase/N-methyltransferase n=2 Tax=Enterobacterales TaxID=91347 RepID=A0A0N0I936_9GAMM|nr:A24 family peptidase [Moellerella wisconsensis]KPD01833.1 leader peptidase/prepilin peptidase/N-methyltransferase [Moellerella wisconsensis ATCC 35017]VFS54468.1 Pectic enzymes secretion protein outO [Moellerella wisconsensis]
MKWNFILDIIIEFIYCYSYLVLFYAHDFIIVLFGGIDISIDAANLTIDRAVEEKNNIINISLSFERLEVIIALGSVIILPIIMLLLLHYIPQRLFSMPTINMSYKYLFPVFFIFIGWVLWHEKNSITLFFLTFFFLLSITLAIIDIKLLLLPDILTFSLLWGGLIFQLLIPQGNIALGIYGVLAGYLLMLFISSMMNWHYQQPQLGHGDLKLIAAYGAWLGVLKLPYLLLGAAVCGIIHYLWLYFRFQRRSAAIPFGPSIVLSGCYWLLIDTYW